MAECFVSLCYRVGVRSDWVLCVAGRGREVTECFVCLCCRAGERSDSALCVCVVG